MRNAKRKRKKKKTQKRKGSHLVYAQIGKGSKVKLLRLMSRCHLRLLIGRPPWAPGMGKPRGLKAAAGLPAMASCDKTELAPDTGGLPKRWLGKLLLGLGNSPGKPGNIMAAALTLGLGADPEAAALLSMAAAAAAAAETAAVNAEETTGISIDDWPGSLSPLTLIGLSADDLSLSWALSSAGSGLNLGGDTAGDPIESFRPLKGDLESDFRLDKSSGMERSSRAGPSLSICKGLTRPKGRNESVLEGMLVMGYEVFKVELVDEDTDEGLDVPSLFSSVLSLSSLS